MTGPQGFGGLTIIEQADEAITVTSTFTTLFTIDMNDFGDGTLILRNDDATQTMQYKIYASNKIASVVPADGDDSWTNIIDLSVDPADYDDNALQTLPTQTTFYESLSNKFRWFRVEMKAQTTTLTAKAWFRAKNSK